MHNAHSRNTVRYYIFALIFFSFLFFSNDFGLIDVQKTAIVMAVGIDREEDGFILTSQIAVPQSSTQGKASEAVQLVSRGETVADAFDEINSKTGWYPKLVFCNLVLLGEKTAKNDVFDVLDFFLREEYLTDDCQIAVCDGLAKDLLNTTALVDPSSSLAIRKVLSQHAERVGTVYPVNLKDFAIGYFGDAQSGLLPVLKTEPQQENIPAEKGKEGASGDSAFGESDDNSGGNDSGSSGDSSGSGGGSQSKQGGNDKPVFSARETALFVRGRWVERLTDEETFALNAAVGKLRLASYSVKVGEQTCTLSIKRNSSKIRLELGKEGKGILNIRLNVVAGLLDYSKAQDLQETKDMGQIPDGAFFAAEQKLAATLVTVYEKARAVKCDVFRLQERLLKYQRREFFPFKDTVLEDTPLSVKVTFAGVR